MGPYIKTFIDGKQVGMISFIFDRWMKNELLYEFADALKIKTADVDINHRRKGIYINMLKYMIKNNKYFVLFFLNLLNLA